MRIFTGIFALLFALYLVGCSGANDTDADVQATVIGIGHIPTLVIEGDGTFLNIYSSRHFVADEEIFRKFTEATGIGINVIQASSGQFVERLRIEGANTSADLIIAADGGILSNAKNRGLLQPVYSDILHNNVPSCLRDADNYFYAMSFRARIIAFANDNDLPISVANYDDLASNALNGRILLRPGNHLYNISLLASLIDIYGYDTAFRWAQDVNNNRARNPQGNDRDQIRAISAGVGDIALINSYYLGLMLHSPDNEEIRAAENISIVFPNQSTTGTHINISGVAVPRYSSNVDAAIRFMEFVTSAQIQQFIADTNFEYPANPLAYPPDFLLDYGDFSKQDINFDALYEYHIQAVEILNIVGW